MEDRIKKLIPGIIVCAFVIFGVFNLFFPVKSLSDVWSYIGYAISIAVSYTHLTLPTKA